MQKRNVVELAHYASRFIHVPEIVILGNKHYVSSIGNKRYYWCAGNDKGLPFWVKDGRGTAYAKKKDN